MSNDSPMSELEITATIERAADGEHDPEMLKAAHAACITISISNLVRFQRSKRAKTRNEIREQNDRLGKLAKRAGVLLSRDRVEV